MEVHVALDLGGDDAEGFDVAIDVLGKGGDAADDLEDAPGGENVRDGGDDVVGGEPEAVLGHDTEAWRAVDDDKVVSVNDGLQGAAEDVLGIGVVVALHGDEGELLLDVDELDAGGEELEPGNAAVHARHATDDGFFDVKLLLAIELVLEKLGKGAAVLVALLPFVLFDEVDGGAGLGVEVNEQNVFAKIFGEDFSDGDGGGGLGHAAFEVDEADYDGRVAGLCLEPLLYDLGVPDRAALECLDGLREVIVTCAPVGDRLFGDRRVSHFGYF